MTKTNNSLVHIYDLFSRFGDKTQIL